MTATLANAIGHSLLAGGVGTTVGALPVLFVRRIAAGVEAALAGFSAGVMMAASFVGLLLPALEEARAKDGELGTLAVLGGTKAYRGASGDALFTDSAEGTDIVITLT